MLARSDCRRVLGDQCHLTDAEIDCLLEQVYALAAILVDASLERAQRPPSASEGDFGGEGPRWSGHEEKSRFTQALSVLEPGERDAVEERAAILEFDAGLDRTAAERAALTGHTCGHVVRDRAGQKLGCQEEHPKQEPTGGNGLGIPGRN